jgi:hypothetical protein
MSRFEGRRPKGFIGINSVVERKALVSPMGSMKEIHDVSRRNDPKRPSVVVTTPLQDIRPEVVHGRDTEIKTEEPALKNSYDTGGEFIRHPDSQGERDSAHGIIHCLSKDNALLTDGKNVTSNLKSDFDDLLENLRQELNEAIQLLESSTIQDEKSVQKHVRKIKKRIGELERRMASKNGTTCEVAVLYAEFFARSPHSHTQSSLYPTAS